MYSATFEHKLDNTTTYQAYDIVQEWVKAQGGRVKENRRPSLVVAEFGSSSSKIRPWEKMARRTFRFDLTQPTTQVVVKVHVSSSLMKDRDAAAHGDEARFNWSQNLTSLWTRLGVTGAEKEEESAGPPASLARGLERGKQMTRYGAIIAAAGYSLLFAPFSPGIASIVVSSIGIILLVNGMTRTRRIKKTLLLMKGN